MSDETVVGMAKLSGLAGQFVEKWDVPEDVKKVGMKERSGEGKFLTDNNARRVSG